MTYIKWNTSYNPASASVRTTPDGSSTAFNIGIKEGRTSLSFSVHPNPKPQSAANRLMAEEFASKAIMEGTINWCGVKRTFKQKIGNLNVARPQGCFQRTGEVSGTIYLPTPPDFEYADLKVKVHVVNPTSSNKLISSLSYSYDRGIGTYKTHPNLASAVGLPPNAAGDWEDIINYAWKDLPATTKLTVSINSPDVADGGSSFSFDAPLNLSKETEIKFTYDFSKGWSVSVGSQKSIGTPEVPPEALESQKIITFNPALEEEFKASFIGKTYEEAVKILNAWRDTWTSKHPSWTGEITRTYNLLVPLLPERVAPTIEELRSYADAKVKDKTKAEAIGILATWAIAQKTLFPALSAEIDRVLANVLATFEPVGVSSWDNMSLADQHALMNKCGEGLTFGDQDKYLKCLADTLKISVGEARELKSQLRNFSEILAEATAFLGLSVFSAAVIATVPLTTFFTAFQSKQAKTSLTLNINKIFSTSTQRTLSGSVYRPTLTSWALKITQNPLFHLVTAGAIITIALWNFTDPIWWSSVFEKWRGDTKKRFEALRIDVSTKVKQIHNLVHISPTSASLAEALVLLKATKPLIIELFGLLDDPVIITELSEKYPEFEKEVEAFIIQFNELVRGAGGTSEDMLELGDIKAPIEETPIELTEKFDKEFTIMNASVEDGDTLNYPNQPEIHNAIRMLGLDTHELGTEAGKEEADYLKSLIEGKTVTIKTHQHKDPAMMFGLYGRLLGGVFINGEDIVLKMLAKFGDDILTATKYQKKYRWIDWDEYKRVATGKPIEAEVGEIKINTKPSYADIWLDGKNTDLKSAEILKNIPLGTHTITLKLFGYADFSTEWEVSEPKRYEIYWNFKEPIESTEETVEKEAMTFSIDSTPTRAKVTIDEVYTHHLTPTDEKEQSDVSELWSVGKHKIRLEKGGYTAEAEIEIVDGMNEPINLELKGMVTEPDVEEELPDREPGVPIDIAKDIKDLFAELETYYVGRAYLSKNELIALKKKYGII